MSEGTVEEERNKTKQVIQRHSLTTSHVQADAQPVSQQKMVNLPKPRSASFY